MVSSRHQSPAVSKTILPLKCLHLQCLGGSGDTADGSEIRLIQLRLIVYPIYPIIYRVVVKIPGDAEVSSIKSILVFNKILLLLVYACLALPMFSFWLLLIADFPVTFRCFGVEFISTAAWGLGVQGWSWTRDLFQAMCLCWICCFFGFNVVCLGLANEFWWFGCEKNWPSDKEIVRHIKLVGFEVIALWECYFKNLGKEYHECSIKISNHLAYNPTIWFLPPKKKGTCPLNEGTISKGIKIVFQLPTIIFQGNLLVYSEQLVVVPLPKIAVWQVGREEHHHSRGHAGRRRISSSPGGIAVTGVRWKPNEQWKKH